MKLKNLIIISIILCLFTISTVYAGDVSNMTKSDEMMNIPNEDSDYVNIGSGNFNSLRNAIESSQVVNLSGDITREGNENDIFLAGGKSAIINGNGHTINANNYGRIFVLNPGSSLVLNNVKLINGNAYYASYEASSDGAAVLNMGNLEINDCTFTNNRARAGGAISCDMCANTIIKGTNTFNYNYAEIGGAISNFYGSKMLISGQTTFDNNYATLDDKSKGGAIINAFSGSYLEINGEAIFNKNKASLDGGAIFNHQATLNLTANSKFTNNEGVIGGAINNENATFYLTGNNIFNSNSGFRGGAIDNSLFESVFTITGTNEFTNNKASMGGAISVQECVALNLYGKNTFTSNKVENSNGVAIGGAIYSYKSKLNINSINTFTQNTATSTTTSAGGAIYSANTNFVMKGNNKFKYCSAADGGAILLIDSTNVEFSGENEFDSNNAATGGAIRANNVRKVMLGSHNYFKNNKASYSGGAIYSQNSELNSQGSLFESNNAQYGGAIFLENTAFAGNYNIFKNNYASSTGTDIESYQSSINSLEYNYWNSQNKVSQNNIHNYNVGNIRNWVILDLTIPSEIKQNTNTEIVKFKNNNYGNLNANMPKYTVSATPNFNPSNIVVTNNIGVSKYTGGIGQTTVSVSSSNFAASKTVNVVEGRIKTTLSGNNIILNDISQSANYEVTLSDENGNKLSGKTIEISVDGKKQSKTTNNQGKVSLTLSNLENGYHEIISTYSGETRYFNSSTTNAIVCLFNNETTNKITGKDIEMYYKDGSKYEVKLTDANNNPLANKIVKIYINGNIYQRETNSEGKASITINLNSGNITILAFYPDKDFAFCENNVYIKSTVSGKDLVKYYRNSTQYYATFLNTNGQLLKNTKIKFNINGVLYERTTDNNGVAKMNINLPPNTYIITAINPVNGEMHSNKITVLGILKGNDLTKYYRNDSQYYITVLGEDGNPVGAGKTVKFNINGVFYERTTDENGVAKMNINLPPNTYIITAEYNQLKYSNTIKVLPVLEGKDLVMRYHDGSKFEAKLVDGQGKPSENKVIIFNVNGVFYNRTTDSSGIARLNINLIAGEYIITSMYDTARASNKITIRS